MQIYNNTAFVWSKGTRPLSNGFFSEKTANLVNVGEELINKFEAKEGEIILPICGADKKKKET